MLRFATSHECKNDDHVRWVVPSVETHAHHQRLGQCPLTDAELTFGCWPDALQIGDSGVGKSCLLLRFAVRLRVARACVTRTDSWMFRSPRCSRCSSRCLGGGWSRRVHGLH